jgi:pimeloyl-ACP methyl ester carboxylesterase
MAPDVSAAFHSNSAVPEAASSMKPWPALAPLSSVLRLRGDMETIFYYDTQKASPEDESAKPVLILIHGLGDEADSWRHLIPLLSGTFRTLALDLPGFGRSAAPGRIGLKRHIAAVLTLLTQTGPAVLAGSSMGALVAEGTALARPDLVQGLILLDGCIPTAADFGKRLLFMALPFAGKKWYRAYRNNHEGAWRSCLGITRIFGASLKRIGSSSGSGSLPEWKVPPRNGRISPP